MKLLPYSSILYNIFSIPGLFFLLSIFSIPYPVYQIVSIQYYNYEDVSILHILSPVVAHKPNSINARNIMSSSHPKTQIS